MARLAVRTERQQWSGHRRQLLEGASRARREAPHAVGFVLSRRAARRAIARIPHAVASDAKLSRRTTGSRSCLRGYRRSRRGAARPRARCERRYGRAASCASPHDAHAAGTGAPGAVTIRLTVATPLWACFRIALEQRHHRNESSLSPARRRRRPGADADRRPRRDRAARADAASFAASPFPHVVSTTSCRTDVAAAVAAEFDDPAIAWQPLHHA